MIAISHQPKMLVRVRPFLDSQATLGAGAELDVIASAS
jgi:hypothetical protein